MKESYQQRVFRLITRACAEGEQQVAGVPIGTYVSKIRDVTEVIATNTRGKTLNEKKLWWFRYSNVFTTASIECLKNNKPSMFIYMFNTPDTKDIFEHCVFCPDSEVRVMFGPDFATVAKNLLPDEHDDNLMSLVRQLAATSKASSEQEETCYFNKCLVCMSLKLGVSNQFKCDHLFCADCISGMWNVNGVHMTCPLCRKAVRNVRWLQILVENVSLINQL